MFLTQEEGAKDTFHRFYTNENVKVGGFCLSLEVVVFLLLVL